MAVAVHEFTVRVGMLDKPPSEEESIGQRVRRLRKARGWSLDRLAQEARKEEGGGTGLSRGTIWEMETNFSRVPWDVTLRAIAAALDVPVEYIRTGKIPANEQSLSDFSPEMYGRAQGIKSPERLRVLRDIVEDFKLLDELVEDEPVE